MRCTSRSWAERRSPCMTARLRPAARAALAPLALPPSPSGGTPPPAVAACGVVPAALKSASADRNLVPVKLSPTKESIVSVTGPGATSPRRRDVGDVSVTLTFTGVMGLVGPRLNASVEPAGTNGRQKRMENRPYPRHMAQPWVYSAQKTSRAIRSDAPTTGPSAARVHAPSAAHPPRRKNEADKAALTVFAQPRLLEEPFSCGLPHHHFSANRRAARGLTRHKWALKWPLERPSPA